MLYSQSPYLSIILLFLYTCAVVIGVYFILVRKKPRFIYNWVCNSLGMLDNRKRFSPHFRSNLYKSGAVLALRFNIKTGKIDTITSKSADVLNLTDPSNTLLLDDFLLGNAKKTLIEKLHKHNRVENHPATCRINNSTFKVLITAEKDTNDDVEAMVINITKYMNTYQEIEDQYFFLRNVLNALPVPVFVNDKSQQCLFANKAFTKTFGNVDDSSNKYSFLVSSDLNEHDIQANFTNILMVDSTTYQAEFATSMNGELHHFEVQRRPLKEKDGQIYGEVGVASDISHRKKIEQDLRDTTHRYKNIFWNAAEGITTVQQDGRLTEANPAMAAMCGYDSPQQLLAEVKYVTQLWRYPEQRSNYLSMLLENRTAVGFEYEFVRRDGTYGWMKISSSGKFSEHDELESIATIVSDITQKKQSELELARCATIDSMTGISNRNALEHHLTTLLTTHPSTPFAVIFLDLNNFKPINDNHGHYTGDKVLEIIAQRLAKGCRCTDFVARLGGDEFIVILEGINSKELLRKKTDSMLKAIEEPIQLNGTSHYISASVGVSQHPEDGSTVIELLKAADASMYDMKRQSKASKINEQLEMLANS